MWDYDGDILALLNATAYVCCDPLEHYLEREFDERRRLRAFRLAPWRGFQARLRNGAVRHGHGVWDFWVRNWRRLQRKGYSRHQSLMSGL